MKTANQLIAEFYYESDAWTTVLGVLGIGVTTGKNIHSRSSKTRFRQDHKKSHSIVDSIEVICESVVEFIKCYNTQILNHGN